MRQLILQMQCSLDGFVCGPNGELDWIHPDFGADYTAWCVERLWQAGAHLMGSKTYREMASYWPSSSEPYAAPMNQIPKVVFSSSLKDASWPETRIVAGNLAEGVTGLKAEPGGDLLAHGGASFGQSLVELGLIDRYRLFVHPVALGKGRPLFSNITKLTRFEAGDRVSFKTGLVVTEWRATGR